jgi:hypothetical protein
VYQVEVLNSQIIADLSGISTHFQAVLSETVLNKSFSNVGFLLYFTKEKGFKKV